MTQTNDQIPQYFYKYCRIDENKLCHSSRIFTDSELYFSKVTEFNDPFDSQYNMKLSGSPAEIEQYLLTTAQPPLNEKELRQRVHEFNQNPSSTLVPAGIFWPLIEKWSICCLSEVQDSLLMWAHYADAHRGFCLRFLNDPTDPFQTSAPDAEPIRPCKVRYSKKYPSINRIGDVDEQTLMFVKALQTKSPEWSYEKEWRILDFNVHGVRRFPRQLLTGVIFGCLMSEKHKEMIRGWCQGRGSEVEFHEARQSATAYSLEFVPAK